MFFRFQINKHNVIFSGKKIFFFFLHQYTCSHLYFIFFQQTLMLQIILSSLLKAISSSKIWVGKWRRRLLRSGRSNVNQERKRAYLHILFFFLVTIILNLSTWISAYQITALGAKYRFEHIMPPIFWVRSWIDYGSTVEYYNTKITSSEGTNYY